jgi:adenosylcobinamide-GDP ribazoletransferase
MKWQVLSRQGYLSKPMLKQCKYFLLALGFFTRIPTPSFVDFTESDLNHAAKYFPLVGGIVGVVGAIVFLLASIYLPHNIAVLISMAATIYMTGAFHEDGLADSADGLGGGWHREQILTIMMDSRLGTYGAVALFLMLFAKFQVLNSLNAYIVPLALIAAHALSRLCAVWIMASLSYSKPEGKAKPLATKIAGLDLLLAHLFGLLPYIGIIVLLVLSQHSMRLIVQFLLMTLIPVLLSWVWWRHKIKRWLGGYTGDTLGAMQQITELAFYLGVLVWSYQA